MAGQSYNLADPEVKNIWEKSLDREVRGRDALLDPETGLAGGENSIVQLRDELASTEGSHIRTKFRYQLTGRGKAGNEVLKGSEEPYGTATDNVYVHTLRHAYGISSPIVQQWITEDAMTEGRDGLADWVATRLSLSLHAHAGGIGLITDNAYRLHNAINAINSSYIIRPNGKTAGNLTSGDVFDVDILNEVAQFVKTVRPKIRPAQTPFGPAYCLFLHPEQVADLRRSNSQWFAGMRAALQGGRIDDNPLYTHALGWDQGFLILESDFVPPGMNSGETLLNANTRRAWVGGAGALTLAFGRGYKVDPGTTLNRWKWVSESEDYQYSNAIAVQGILGAKRMRYTKPGEASAREAGVVVIETYVDHGQLTAAESFAEWTAISGVAL